MSATPFGARAFELPDWTPRYEAIPEPERKRIEKAIAPVYPTTSARRKLPCWRELWLIQVVYAHQHPREMELAIISGPKCAPQADDPTSRMADALNETESVGELKRLAAELKDGIAALPAKEQQQLRQLYGAKLAAMKVGAA